MDNTRTIINNTKVIKSIFTINVHTAVSDTEDESTGEASVGYDYGLDTSLPELAFAIAGFLKAIDTDEDIKKVIDGEASVGTAFISLLQAYYDKDE